ncbi:MAG: LPS assembly protein LptD [Alphaproteobacteria bacterium]
MTHRRLAALAAIAAASLLATVGARAQSLPEVDAQSPVLFTADELQYDDTLGVVTARGNVELTQDNRTVIADTLVYDQVNDLITAQGNVALLEPTGEVLFTDFAELTGDLRNAVIANLGILLSDNARLAANIARRSRDGTRTELAQAVYSPCEVCAEDPTPLWQIKASRVVYDQTDETVRYRDATLEFFGVPLLYTPYLQHPGPNVKRQTGLLAPTFGSSSQLGGYVRAPFYIVIDDQSDATVEPFVTGDRGVAFVGEYRRIFEFGELEARGSATVADRDEGNGIVKEQAFRGHLDAFGIYSIDENWRAGHDLRLSTDDTYRRLYGFDSPTILTSNVYAEGFYGRSYGRADFFAFKDQRPADDANDTPIIFPELLASYVGEPNDFGAYWTVEASSRSLHRGGTGSDSHRFSLGAGWHVPYVSSVGEVVDLSLSLRGDAYYVQDYVNPLTGEVIDGETVGRLFPQAAITWRWPLARYVPPYQVMIEPIAGIVVSPFGNNPEQIPDEDSRGFELDTTNLFDGNRFPGYDRVEGGQRINYGVNMAVYGDGGGYSSLFLGQSLRFGNDDEAFVSGTGVEDELSDLVGRVEIQPDYNFSLVDRFRFNLEDQELKAHDVSLSVGPPALRLSAQYVYALSGDATGEFDDREEVSAVLSSQIDDWWRISTRVRYDLNEGATRVAGFNLAYEDECFVVAGDFERSFFEDREIQQDDRLTVRIGLKTLGELSL